MNTEPSPPEGDLLARASKAPPVTLGVGVAWPLLLLIVCLAIVGAVAVGWLSRWAALPILGLLLGSAVVVTAVLTYSQRDLIRFRQERGRWPAKEELGLWNQEMHARREKARRVAGAKSAARGAEQEFRRRVALAEGALRAAERHRQEEINRCRAMLTAAQDAHARAVAEARAGLEAWRNPGLGGLLTTSQGVALYAHYLVTSRSQIPVASVQVIVIGRSLLI